MSKYELGCLNTLITKFFEGAAYIQPRCAFFDKENTHATIGRMNSCISASQDGKNTTIHTIRYPELGAIELISIAIAYSGHSDGLHIAACIGLRDADSTTFLTPGHHRQEASALLLCTKRRNHVGNE